MPALLSSLIDVPRDDLSGVLAGDGPARPCLREWLARVPDPRSPLGRRHPLQFVLALAICAFTAAGHDSPSAIADWASSCSQQVLTVLDGRRDPWTGKVRPPCERTFRRVFAKVDASALNDAVHGCLAAMPQAAPGDLAEATRPDGSRVHLLSAFHVGEGRAMAQREVGAKTNEIPELAPAIEGLDLAGWVVTVDALQTQREAARLISEVKGGHYLMIVKANQPTLLAQVTAALTGTDAEFAGASRAEEGKGHGRRERRGIRTAPAADIDWPGAAQVMRIRRDTGPTAGHWTSKEVAYGITSLPPALAGPRHLAIYVRQHWGIENREHYVRDVTFREDAQKARTGSQPAAYAAIRNLAIGAARKAGFANIAHARRYYARDDHRILTLYGYAQTDTKEQRVT